MALTLPTPADIRAIMATGLTDAQLTAVIADAGLMVRACVESLDSELQAAIIKYAAADLIASAVSTTGRGVLTSRSLGDASDSWSLGSGATLGGSAYWHRALMLDPNGCLARLGGRTVTFEKV